MSRLSNRSVRRSLARFAATGIAANLGHALVFVVLGTISHAGTQVLNLAATATSTVLANEMHRQFSLAPLGRPSWLRTQFAGSVMAAVGLAVSSGALALWDLAEPDASRLSSLAVVYAAGAAVGLVNFVVLRRGVPAPEQSVATAAEPRAGSPLVLEPAH